MSDRLKQIKARHRAARPGKRMIAPNGEVVVGGAVVVRVETSGAIPAHLRAIVRMRAEARWERVERTFVESAHIDVEFLLARVAALESARDVLLAAYEAAEASGGSLDFSDLDRAHAAAVATKP